jgi:hypothetical protein
MRRNWLLASMPRKILDLGALPNPSICLKRSRKIEVVHNEHLTSEQRQRRINQILEG